MLEQSRKESIFCKAPAPPPSGHPLSTIIPSATGRLVRALSSLHVGVRTVVRLAFVVAKVADAHVDKPSRLRDLLIGSVYETKSPELQRVADKRSIRIL